MVSDESDYRKNMEEPENKAQAIHDIYITEEKQNISISDMLEHADEVANTIRSQTDKMIKVYESLNDAVSSWIAFQDAIREPVIKAIENYQRLINQIDYQKITSNIQTAFQQIQQAIDYYAQNLAVPSITEERKQQLLESHRMWGSYGWTFAPNGEWDDLFCTSPSDKKEADRKVSSRIKDSENIFNSIYSHKRAKKSDVSEAIKDYNDKRYKSCALILLGLIDAQLIRFQRYAETQGNRRKVGSNAILKAKKRVGIDDHDDWFSIAMFYGNLFACLEKIFEDTNDFKNQAEIINRNYLCHGMLSKPVRRRDCLQLFLLYYNMLEMLDMEYGIAGK